MAVPAQADIFNFNDEYYISSSAMFAAKFPGCMSPCYVGAGVYQMTQDAAHGGVLVTRLSTSGVPGEYLQNTTPNKQDFLQLSGWTQSLNNGQQVADVFNSTNPGNGAVLFFTYTVGGVNTPFTFNSFDLSGASANANLNFTLEGFLNNVLVDSAVLNVTGSTFVTFTENWSNINKVEIASTASLPVNWGSNTLVMDNVVLNAVPEPASVALLGIVLVGFSGMIRRKLSGRSRDHQS
jgi:PEP-CTERM motif